MSVLSPRFSLLLDGVWVDVSEDVRANTISIIRGRDSESDSLKPSSVKFSLHNNDLKYSNRNPLSPYFGKLKRNIPVKIELIDGAFEYPRFYGEVASWEPRWNEDHSDQTVLVSASGITRRLNQGTGELLSSMQWTTQIEGTYSPTVDFYWPLESVNSDFISNPTVGNVPAIIRTTRQPSKVSKQGPLSEWLPNVIGLTSGDSVYALPLQSRTFTSNGQGIGFNAIVSGGQGQVFTAEVDCGTVMWKIVLTFATDTMTITNNLGHSSSNAIGVDLDNGSPMMLEFDWRRHTSSTTSIYNVTVFDAEADSRSGWSNILTYPVNTVRGVTLTCSATDSSILSVGHVVVNYFSTAYGTYDIEDAAAGFPKDLISTRLSFVESAEPDIDISTSFAYTNAYLGRMKPGTFLDQLMDMELLSPAEWVEDSDAAGLTLYNTSHAQSSLTTTLDYSDGEVAAPFEPAEDDRFTKNDITVRVEDGGEVRLVKETGAMSVAAPEDGGVGRYEFAQTINAYFETHAALKAGWLLERGTFEGPRFPSVSVDLASPDLSASARSGLLQVIPGRDYLKITNLQAIGLYENVILRIVGMQENIGPSTHTITFNCVPGDHSYYPFIIGTHPVDSDTSTLTSGISSSATSLSVTTVGETWTYSSNFDIHVGGERMTVTAISGSSSPFTFTVTRSVNGVVKTHSAGSAIVLADRKYVRY